MKPCGAEISAPLFLERAGHAPSPLINGRVLTMTDSKDHFCLNSPDIRNHKFMQSQLNSSHSCGSLTSNDELNDQDMLAEEIKFFNTNLNGYKNEDENSLLSQLTCGDQSSIKLQQNSPHHLQKDQISRKGPNKARNVQESLLKYLSSQIKENLIKEQRLHSNTL